MEKRGRRQAWFGASKNIFKFYFTQTLFRTTHTLKMDLIKLE